MILEEILNAGKIHRRQNVSNMTSFIVRAQPRFQIRREQVPFRCFAEDPRAPNMALTRERAQIHNLRTRRPDSKRLNDAPSGMSAPRAGKCEHVRVWVWPSMADGEMRAIR